MGDFTYTRSTALATSRFLDPAIRFLLVIHTFVHTICDTLPAAHHASRLPHVRSSLVPLSPGSPLPYWYTHDLTVQITDFTLLPTFTRLHVGFTTRSSHHLYPVVGSHYVCIYYVATFATRCYYRTFTHLHLYTYHRLRMRSFTTFSPPHVRYLAHAARCYWIRLDSPHFTSPFVTYGYTTFTHVWVVYCSFPADLHCVPTQFCRSRLFTTLHTICLRVCLPVVGWIHPFVVVRFYIRLVVIFFGSRLRSRYTDTFLALRTLFDTGFTFCCHVCCLLTFATTPSPTHTTFVPLATFPRTRRTARTCTRSAVSTPPHALLPACTSCVVLHTQLPLCALFTFR